ncbi:MAG TPA: tripartite tricarboxylate transporter substrate binding protein [Burkholderiales bacterium]|nr:tripartite tricarboxylate transporter substrate binding protein [Burkholderiales bacterium]
MGRSPFLLIEAPAKPDNTLADLIARAKANPGKLSYASAGVGTVTHLAAARFLQQTGLKMLHVPYKGNGPALPDVMSGRVELIFEAYGSSRAHINHGTFKALGITSTARLLGLSNVPTFEEQGVPNYTYYTWMYLFAPAGTSPEIVQRLSAALRSATAKPDMKDRFREDGVETLDMSTQQVNESLVRHAADASKLMADLGISKQ